MLRMKNITPRLSFKDNVDYLEMKNITTRLSFKDNVDYLEMKNITTQLSFNLKIYTEYHTEYYKLLELFN